MLHDEHVTSWHRLKGVQRHSSTVILDETADARRWLLSRFNLALPIRWRWKPCPWRCDAVCSQRHILGGCGHFHDAYVARHDAALRTLLQHLNQSNAKQHMFDHIVCNTSAGHRTDLVRLDLLHTDHQLRHVQPDFVLVSNSSPYTVLLIELTVCGDSPDAIHIASVEKRRRYEELRDAICVKGWACSLIVLTIGQLGTVPRTALRLAGRCFQSSKSVTSHALQAVSRCVHRRSLDIIRIAVAQLARSTTDRNPLVADLGIATLVHRPPSSTMTSRPCT